MNEIIQGDARTVLSTMGPESVDCVVTSPPYWSLRDYDVDGQIGSEPTIQEYINSLCDVFGEIKRVLKKEGTCWVNIGDTYRNKQLCQIPSRFAIEMCDRGWILRNKIIWYKRNSMPSSVKDRFTVDYEEFFFFVKSKKYYFETQYEPVVNHSDAWYRHKLRQNKNYQLKKPYQHNFPIPKYPDKKNKRCVWDIPTNGFKDAHFAVFPEALVETPIKAGCPENGIVLDPFIGSGTVGVVTIKQSKQIRGIELNPSFIELARARMKPYLEQKKLIEIEVGVS